MPTALILYLPLRCSLIIVHCGTPLYNSYRPSLQGTHVFLLGDIGLVKDEGLFSLLRTLLNSFRGTRFFYVLGNHKPYQTTLSNAIERFRVFEEEAKREYGGRFIFLHRNRVDGIRDWSYVEHLMEHRRDKDWLNDQVKALEKEQPQRASDPRHHGSDGSSGFSTDMSHDICWKSAVFKLWMFGHTHWNCDFRDEATGKLLVTNQRGYGHDSFSVTITPQVRATDYTKSKSTPEPSSELPDRPKRPLLHKTASRVNVVRRSWSQGKN
ncbi:Metallo-dependent phosphatase-like protein [Xylariomycetidae sp. FL2044]|nr:Metallo-dependent phosphatase-like protein [Xylariomycetidae sp. FL2044]